MADLGGQALVVTRMRIHDGRLISEPLSLLHRTERGELDVEALYFPSQSKGPATRTKALGNTALAETFGKKTRQSLNVKLQELTDTLRRSAEQGTDDAFKRQLDKCITSLRAVGFNGFTTSLSEEALSHYLLRINFVRTTPRRPPGFE